MDETDKNEIAESGEEKHRFHKLNIIKARLEIIRLASTLASIRHSLALSPINCVFHYKGKG